MRSVGEKTKTCSGRKLVSVLIAECERFVWKNARVANNIIKENGELTEESDT